MKDKILSNLNDPEQLERLYRSDKQAFRSTMKTLYANMHDSNLVRYWKARLEYSREDFAIGNSSDLLFVVIASTLAGLVAKLPDIFNIDEEFFYPRNAGFIIFPFLVAFYIWKNGFSIIKIIVIAVIILTSAIFINLLPHTSTSDTLVLSCIHLLFVLWSVFGFSFVGKQSNRISKRLSFLKFNGDLVVITTLIVIAAGILTAVTIGLFSLIGFNIEQFYFKNIVVFGLPAAPILGTYLAHSNPQLVGRVSPVIAKIFSPLVLIMLVIYLVVMVYSGKDPYNNREFLIIFNVLLIGVMAIIFFSIAEGSKTSKSYSENWILLLLSIATIVVNGIALSAIVFRISEWGITPNRIAVLGANLLILTNLILVTTQLFRVVAKKEHTGNVGRAIAAYLPIYLAWAAIVTFLFPFLFSFR